jgi:hypothetical protein
MMVEFWTRNRPMGDEDEDEDENNVEDYKQISEIRGTTCVIGCR